MKKLLLLLFAVAMAFGCDKEDEEFIDDYYTLSSIKYFAMEGKGHTKEVTITEHPQFENNSGERVNHYLHTIEECITTSVFIPDAVIPENYLYDAEEYVSTPSVTDTNGENGDVFTDAKKYFKFVPLEIQDRPSDVRWSKMVTLPPYTKVTHLCEVTREVFTVTFHAEFTGNVTGEVRQVPGKWIGTKEMTHSYCETVFPIPL